MEHLESARRIPKARHSNCLTNRRAHPCRTLGVRARRPHAVLDSSSFDDVSARPSSWQSGEAPITGTIIASVRALASRPENFVLAG